MNPSSGSSDNVISYSVDCCKQSTVKGGEKLKSEWEQLESLSKDELIIELMKARWQLKNLCEVIRDAAEDAADRYVYASGVKTTHEWIMKIGDYAVAHDDMPHTMAPSSLVKYNLDEDQAEEYFDEVGYPEEDSDE